AAQGVAGEQPRERVVDVDGGQLGRGPEAVGQAIPEPEESAEPARTARGARDPPSHEGLAAEPAVEDHGGRVVRLVAEPPRERERAEAQLAGEPAVRTGHRVRVEWREPVEPAPGSELDLEQTGLLDVPDPAEGPEGELHEHHRGAVEYRRARVTAL